MNNNLKFIVYLDRRQDWPAQRSKSDSQSVSPLSSLRQGVKYQTKFINV